MSTFIDTSALIAMLDADDPNHEAAGAAWIGMLQSEDELVTSNYVVLESVAVLHKRFGVSAVRLLHSDVLPAVEMLWVEEAAHSAGVSAVMAGGRHGPSLVDCVSFELIDRLHFARVFAFDAHFEERGLELVS